MGSYPDSAAAAHRIACPTIRCAHTVALGGVCGIEYAAQAMAVHGAFARAEERCCPPIGYLGSLRAVTLYVARLDQ